MGFFSKMADLSAGLKDSVVTSTEKVVAAASEAELGTKLSGLKNNVLEGGADYLAAGKDKCQIYLRRMCGRSRETTWKPSGN